MQVLDRLLDVLRPRQIADVVADREFISVQWLKRLKAEAVRFAVRVRSDRRVQRSSQGARFPVRMMARTMARTASPGYPRVTPAVRALQETREVLAERFAA